MKAPPVTRRRRDGRDLGRQGDKRRPVRRARAGSTPVPPRTRAHARRAHEGDGRPPREGIDPRIRARRAAVLRNEARRRLKLALLVLVGVLLVVGGWLVLHSRLFSARVVTVVGSVHTPASQIIDAAGLAQHPPLVDVNGSTAARIERLPWVAHATVAREWPDGVKVTVVERTPVATVREKAPRSGWAVVDHAGVVLTVDAARPPGLETIAGSAHAGAPGSVVASARPALAVARSLPTAFRAQVADVAQDPHGDVTLQLTSPLTVYLGSTGDLSKKYEDVAAILAGASLQAGSQIDVSVPNAPVVRPGA